MGNVWSIVKMLHFLQDITTLVVYLQGRWVHRGAGGRRYWGLENKQSFREIPQSRMAGCSLYGHSVGYGDSGLTVEALKSGGVPGAYRMLTRGSSGAESSPGR